MSRRARKLRCRICGTACRHGEAWRVSERTATGVCDSCFQRAIESKDTGWEIMPTTFGPRFHREIGATIQLDVERQVTTWMGSIVRMGVLRAVIRDQPTAAAAARAIEERATELFREDEIVVDASELPDPEGGARG